MPTNHFITVLIPLQYHHDIGTIEDLLVNFKLLIYVALIFKAPSFIVSLFHSSVTFRSRTSSLPYSAFFLNQMSHPCFNAISLNPTADIYYHSSNYLSFYFLL